MPQVPPGLIGEGVSLVHSDNASTGAASVAENSLGDLQPYAELLQASRYGAAQIV
jgi:hypothetical protein